MTATQARRRGDDRERRSLTSPPPPATRPRDWTRAEAAPARGAPAVMQRRPVTLHFSGDCNFVDDVGSSSEFRRLNGGVLRRVTSNDWRSLGLE
ncbi:unnamed protein product [Cuscuta campestris]|uniref:Uncharacterized protein n=1 Tax=Cuscuta campestris TaxID=132261 RepID=A0A484NNQ2_9ASTE|nr:unnamed protein product [Cuscuta campestris]